MKYQDLKSPQLFSRITGWLGFVPSTVNFHQFPLDLFWSRQIEHHDGLYRLACKEAQYWDRLGAWFSHMVRPFTSREWGQPARQVMIPPSLNISHYLGMHHTPGGVYAACRYVQGIFVLWLAYFTFQLSMGDKGSYSDPSAQWWCAECQELGVPETILFAIMSQVAWDGSIPCIGIIH